MFWSPNRTTLAATVVALSLVGSACGSDQAAIEQPAAVDYSEAMANAQGDIADLAQVCMGQRGFAGETSVAELSPSESEAYLVALMGDAAEPGPEALPLAEAIAVAETVIAEQFDVRFGCQPLAEFAIQSRIVGTESLDNAVTLEDLVASDPVIVQLQLDWSRCMREAGFDVTDQNDVEELIAQSNESIAGDDEPRVGSDETAPETDDDGAQSVAMSDFETEIRDAADRCWAPVADQADDRIAEILSDQ